MDTQVSKGESAMSYWDSKVFSRIYRRIQKFSQRHPEQMINVLETARREFYALEDSLKMLGKPLSMQAPRTEEPVITEDTPPIEVEDEIIRVAGMSIRESEWRELMEIQKVKGVAKTLTPDQKMFLYLKSLFRGDR